MSSELFSEKYGLKLCSECQCRFRCVIAVREVISLDGVAKAIKVGFSPDAVLENIGTTPHVTSKANCVQSGVLKRSILSAELKKEYGIYVGTGV